jgi:arginine deiminase
VDSEVGTLRTVLMHRPGRELQRMTPRNKDRLLFDTLPWVGRARQEHDVLTQQLRDQGVQVLYLTELLQDALEYQQARDEAIFSVLADAALGDELRAQLRGQLDDLAPEALAEVLIAGLTPDELTMGHGVVFELLDRHDFVIDPLPNLVFTRDSSFWIGDHVAVASMAAESRRREADLAGVIYRHHPLFAGTRFVYWPGLEHVEGGDVLLLAPHVLAIGVGQRTLPAGAERLASHVFQAGLATTVLAVPMDQRDGAGHLDTLCTVIDSDAVVMHPKVAYSLTAHTITPRPGGMRVSRAQPFLEAAAQAMGIGKLTVIDTCVDTVRGPRDQWDNGANALAIGPRLAVCHERNVQTNARLQDAGVAVIPVPSSELGSGRGGPRCMSCAITRDSALLPQHGAPGADAMALYREMAQLVQAEAATRPEAVPAALAAAGQAAAGQAAAVGVADRAQPEPSTDPCAHPVALPDQDRRDELTPAG